MDLARLILVACSVGLVLSTSSVLAQSRPIPLYPAPIQIPRPAPIQVPIPVVPAPMRGEEVGRDIHKGVLVPVYEPAQNLIPKEGFKSWSLFLPCNPAWLVPEKGQALADIHHLYVAFGKATGPQHAAVWFFTGEDPDKPDKEYSVIYCQKFGLKPSEGPYIVVTTVSPDEWSGQSKVVLAFGRRPVKTIAEMVLRLTDQVQVEQLSQEDVDSVGYWQSWIRVIEGACKYLAKTKFSLTVKGALQIERTGLCGDTSS